MTDINVPEAYRSLLKRVEEIEQVLSKKTLGDQQVQPSSDHAEEPQADEVDEDLTTEKISPVTISSKAYLKMAIHAKKYANPATPQENWVEVIGLMTGRIKNEDTPLEQIQVVDAWPIGHGDAVSVEIIGTKSFSEVINSVQKGDFIVGWYHSHPSYSPFMSTDDHATQARYQALWSKAIALVIDPTMISKSDYGFGVFRNSTKERANHGYTELSTEVEGLSASAAVDILQLIRPAFEGQELEFIEYE